MNQLQDAARKVLQKTARFMVRRRITDAIDRIVSDRPEVLIGQSYSDSELTVICFALEALERRPWDSLDQVLGETAALRNSGGVFGTGTGATNGQTKSEVKSA
jgi:hypothetical protein